MGAHESRPLQYGPERGDWGLITALARFLTEHYRFEVHSQQLLISNGNSQAIDLCCAAFTTPGDTVFVEEPTYFLALRIFADHGLKVIGVPVDDQGLRIDTLEAELEKHSPRLIYTVPTGHNPTGSSLPAQRRRRLVELARAHRFLVLADEVYQLLDYTGSAPKPLAAQLESGVVVSLGTFSKILAPGLRVGWIHTNEHLLAALAGRGQLVSGGGLNPLTSPLIAPILADGGVGHYLNTIRSILGDRMTTMDEALRAGLPATASYHRPDAGYFFWVRLPDDIDTTSIHPRAMAAGVGFQPGPVFSTCAAQRNCLRLSFAYYNESAIRTAVARLCRVLTDDGS